MTHTPGLWVVSKSNRGAIPQHFQPPVILARGGHLCVADQMGNGPEAEANARRIVACVNGCAGVTNEELRYANIVRDAIDFCKAYVRFLDGSTNALCGMAKIARQVADSKPS